MAAEPSLQPTEPLDDAGWQVPAFDVVELFPRRTTYCVCVPVINEGERIARQLAKMQPMADLADILLLDGGSTEAGGRPAAESSDDPGGGRLDGGAPIAACSRWSCWT